MAEKKGSGPVRQRPTRLRRPHVVAGLAVAITAYLLLQLADMPDRLRAVLSWDAGAAVTLIVLLLRIRGATPDHIRKIAALQDPGKWIVVSLTLVAAFASLFAIAGEMHLIKDAQGMAKTGPIALVVVTILLSWTLIHAMFAVRYAHDYYSRSPGAEGGRASEKLDFPGKDEPVYVDFFYFSFTIGMTFQVSDVEIAVSGMRGLALAHGIISFFFTTGILALMVNLVGGSA